MTVTIHTMKPEDWPRMQQIYREGIATGNATFETAAPPWSDWDESHLKQGRLVAKKGDKVVGWAALSPVSTRCVYANVAEVSIYVAASARRQGVGNALLQGLISVSEAHGIWTLQAGIFIENEASIILHQRCGFREIGYQERIGQLNGVWRTVLLMERRSNVVGI